MLTNSSAVSEPCPGLTIRRNQKNGFTVIRLHYTADPAKRSREWLEEARAGMTPAQFAREYEIDYTAMFGQRAFPQMQTHRSAIVVDPPYPEFPADHPFFAGFDFGIRNPSAFVVFTWLDRTLYAVWELYEPCTSIVEFSAKMRACPYWSSIRYIAADPHIASVHHFNRSGSPASILSQFAEHGITRFVLAPTNEAAWLALMHQHWADPSAPTFRIFARCANLIAEFTNITYDDPPRMQISADPRERLTDARNHALDATKYAMLVRPTVEPPKPKVRWAHPILSRYNR